MDDRALTYLDHHATTPLAQEALAAMLPWLTGLAANPSAVHRAGRAARRAVEDAREEIASLLGAAAAEIVFTSGGTESDNLALRGGARAARRGDPARNSVLFSAAEHPAVREAAVALESEGFRALELAVDADGLPRDPVPVGGDTALVSMILANNETGVVNDRIADLAERTRAAGAHFHTDAVQAIGKVAVRVERLGVDLLSLTGHKFGGPKGAGVLYVRKGVRVEPILSGGGQERGRRGGTENVAAIAGLAAAYRVAVERLAAETVRLTALRDRFESGLEAALPEVRVNGTTGRLTRRVPTCSSVRIPGAESETLVAALDLEGIAVSAGSACHAGTTAPSRVLLACGLSPAEARSTLRVSFGRTTTDADVDRILALLPRIARNASATLLA